MSPSNLKASSSIQRDFPDLILPRASDTIAGLLYVPLTAKAGQDFIVFLRKGQVREVQWAGKPYKDDKASEEASLEPRKSFKAWTETVTGCSRAWTDDQLESAGVLALIYGKFIQVWREKQTAMASNQLTAILLSNTSHAVRTPLSQIINTLELALAGNIDGDVRKMLENSHQASRALLFHVHDLLDLTRIETGNETAFNDPFDIRQSISDAVRLYQTEVARRGLEFRVNMAEDLLSMLLVTLAKSGPSFPTSWPTLSSLLKRDSLRCIAVFNDLLMKSLARRRVSWSLRKGTQLRSRSWSATLVAVFPQFS